MNNSLRMATSTLTQTLEPMNDNDNGFVYLDTWVNELTGMGNAQYAKYILDNTTSTATIQRQSDIYKSLMDSALDEVQNATREYNKRVADYKKFLENLT